jgi:hypothetical protein
MTLRYRILQIAITGKQITIAVENGSQGVIVDIGKIIGDSEIIG